MRSSHMFFHNMAKTRHVMGKMFRKIGLPAEAAVCFAERKRFVELRRGL